MDKTMLALKRGTVPAESGGKTGVTLEESTRFARDGRQKIILEMLIQGGQSLSAVLSRIEKDSPPGEPGEAQLALAEFILDFSDFLQ